MYLWHYDIRQVFYPFPPFYSTIRVIKGGVSVGTMLQGWILIITLCYLLLPPSHCCYHDGISLSLFIYIWCHAVDGRLEKQTFLAVCSVTSLSSMKKWGEHSLCLRGWSNQAEMQQIENWNTGELSNWLIRWMEKFYLANLCQKHQIKYADKWMIYHYLSWPPRLWAGSFTWHFSVTSRTQAWAVC